MMVCRLRSCLSCFFLFPFYTSFIAALFFQQELVIIYPVGIPLTGIPGLTDKFPDNKINLFFKVEFLFMQAPLTLQDQLFFTYRSLHVKRHHRGSLFGRKIVKIVKGSMIGTLFSSLFVASGLKGAFHEVVGRQWIGMRTTFTTGAANVLGRALGEEGLLAWLSLSGSIPTLALTSSLTFAGVKLFEERPKIGAALLSFSFVLHSLTLKDLWSCVGLSYEALLEKGDLGNDFAAFATHLSKVTPFSSGFIASAQAIGWTLFVPLVALCTYLHNQGEKGRFLSDEQALALAMKSDLLHDELYRFALQNPICSDATEKQRTAFAKKFMNSLSKNRLNEVKAFILKSEKKGLVVTKQEQIIGWIAVANSVGLTSVRVIQVLGKTLFPYLAATGELLRCTSPLFGCVSLIPTTYQTYRDLNSTLPRSLKVISVAQAVSAFLVASAIVLGQLFPPLMLSTFILMGAGLGAELILGAIKGAAIRQHMQNKLN
jgi:hypothetical protein